MALSIVLATALVASATAAADGYVRPRRAATLPYRVETNLVYGEGLIGDGAGTRSLLLDLYIPEGGDAGPRPLMVMIHGGGFFFGDKTERFVAPAARQHARRGWIVASINYRLAVERPVAGAAVQPLWDAIGGMDATLTERTQVTAIDDTLKALRYLHARSDVAPTATVLHGSSAGAVTALNVGYLLDDYGISSPPISAVVAREGALTIGAPDGSIFDGGDEPPLFVAHGKQDTLVPLTDAFEIVGEARRAGIPVGFRALPRQGHGINVFDSSPTNRLTLFRRITLWLGRFF